VHKKGAIMWYKLNQSIGIVLLIAVVAGGAFYVFSGPPLLRQNDQHFDPRQNGYTRQIMEEHDKIMRDLQRQQAAAFEDAMEMGRRALSQ
jgi:hypothetical protein